MAWLKAAAFSYSSLLPYTCQTERCPGNDGGRADYTSLCWRMLACMALKDVIWGFGVRTKEDELLEGKLNSGQCFVCHAVLPSELSVSLGVWSHMVSKNCSKYIEEALQSAS